MTAVAGGGQVSVWAPDLYADGLRAATSTVARARDWLLRYDNGATAPMDFDRWCAPLTPGDSGLLARCTGPTLDVGCGPGRLTAELAHRGVPALGIDISPGALRIARDAGAAVLRRSVFDRVPGAGTWSVVLLADGNIGIGGDPVVLLRRAADLLGPHGVVVCELDGPDTATGPVRVRIEAGDGARSQWFDWAHVGVDAIAGIAGDATLSCGTIWQEAGRWFATLGKTTLDPAAVRPSAGTDD
ncbi:MAG: methyltransferase domain-containing protein [Actinomycetota bacterium]|nr:methyltransferase domain-containing protein [Actinomycetota bacterium]